jgi:GxxExxY protein
MMPVFARLRRTMNTRILATDCADYTEETMTESNLLYHEVTRKILGAFFQVHSDLGEGFLESVYVNALCVLLRRLGLTVEREVPFEIVYYGVPIGLYRADVVVERKVILEVRTGRVIDPVYLARLRNYLRVSKLEVGLLLNFGPSAEFKRMIATANGKTTTTG